MSAVQGTAQTSRLSTVLRMADQVEPALADTRRRIDDDLVIPGREAVGDGSVDLVPDHLVDRCARACQ